MSAPETWWREVSQALGWLKSSAAPNRSEALLVGNVARVHPSFAVTVLIHVAFETWRKTREDRVTL